MPTPVTPLEHFGTVGVWLDDEPPETQEILSCRIVAALHGIPVRHGRVPARAVVSQPV
jgi:hypothetical protein